MEFDQDLQFIDSAYRRRFAKSFSEVERTLLLGVWNNLSYDDIAKRYGYSVNYLQRDIGPKFWKRLSEALARPVNKKNLRTILTNHTLPQSTPQHKTITSWGEAINTPNFYGRTEEIEILTQWIIKDHCQLIRVEGIGGVGKSTLVAKVAQLLKKQFEYVIWRSLRNAPPLETLLAELVGFLSQHQDPQATPERLLYWLQTHRCLVILDNQETLLQTRVQAGTYQPLYRDYSHLFQLLGESQHKSCLLLTSREKSAEIAYMEEPSGSVRSLLLQGSKEASLAFLERKQLMGTDREKQDLCELYSYNPLALKIVSNSILSLFAGDIGTFLSAKTPVLGGIRCLLEKQFERLSTLEETIINWLGINREWTEIAKLQKDIVPTVSHSHLYESLESLTWRSLIKKRVVNENKTSRVEYTLQPVLMDYVIDTFIERSQSELLALQTTLFNQYALIKTSVADHIRESQTRLILSPLGQQLQTTFHNNKTQLEDHLRHIFAKLRHSPESAFGYGISNFINLCLHLQINLRGYDFSDLTLRQAAFQGTHLSQSTFTQGFGECLWLRFRPDGQQLPIGDIRGKVDIWQFQEMQPQITLQDQQGWIFATDWSPDDTTLVSGVDQTVRLWNLRTGICEQIIQCANHVLCVDWNPLNGWLAISHLEEPIQFWDLERD